MSERPKFRHYIEAIPLFVIPHLLRPIPFDLRVRIGGAIIAALIRWVPKLRHRVRDNLALVYPEKTAAQRRSLARQIARNIGWGYIEIVYCSRYHDRLSNFHLQTTLEPLKHAVNAGRPVILVSSHFGSWDAIRALLSAEIAPVGALFKRPTNPILGARYAREVGAGLPMFEVTPRGMAEMVRFLKDGRIVAILTDQRTPDGEWLDFMGHPARTALSAAKLAIRTNALLIPCYGVRRANVADIDVYLEPAIAHGDPVEMTKAINDSITARVRANPEQWYWLHRRWKSDDAQNTDSEQ